MLASCVIIYVICMWLHKVEEDVNIPFLPRTAKHVIFSNYQICKYLSFHFLTPFCFFNNSMHGQLFVMDKYFVKRLNVLICEWVKILCWLNIGNWSYLITLPLNNIFLWSHVHIQRLQPKTYSMTNLLYVKFNPPSL